jgi:hypothetical protein
MWITKCLSVLVLFVSATTSSHAATFKALRDFAALNPNGAWSYGYGKPVTAFTLYDTFTHDCLGRVGLDCWNASIVYPAQVAVNVTGASFVFGGSALAVTNALLLHPGAGLERTIVRWTSPKSGTYEASGFFELLDVAPTGVRPVILVNNKLVTVEAFQGDSGNLTGPGANLNTLKPGQRKNFLLTRFARKGTILTFAVNPAQNYSNDTTGFDVTIKRIGP